MTNTGDDNLEELVSTHEMDMESVSYVHKENITGMQNFHDKEFQEMSNHYENGMDSIAVSSTRRGHEVEWLEIRKDHQIPLKVT